ncbi:hypothetical protein BGC07_16945 [Piscirickettsia litoralis]|uniref:Uncharacterized protein n=1 Tax=Piscirickettsia litoralis TaxID=1891921 RepID=A0ABX2ZY02_9GAMM|nr:hypothetical protein BGC07_16945 [Piscirickettsia litoralis]
MAVNFIVFLQVYNKLEKTTSCLQNNLQKTLVHSHFNEALNCVRLNAFRSMTAPLFVMLLF